MTGTMKNSNFSTKAFLKIIYFKDDQSDIYNYVKNNHRVPHSQNI